jgi:hypothetical protein
LGQCGARYICDISHFGSAPAMKEKIPFVAYVPSFNFGDDALLMLVDQSTIAWLMSRFGELADTPVESKSAGFVIGDGKPFESAGQCIISVELNHQANRSELTRTSETTYSWILPPRSAAHYRDLLSGMSGSKSPCHQYLDPDNAPPAPVVIVSLDEYEPETFRQKV